MPVFRQVVLATALGLSAVMVPFAGALTYAIAFEPRYDARHPDHDRYAAVLATIREQLSQRSPGPQDALDLSALNGGDWTTACAFGGYRNPSEAMAKLGAEIGSADRLRLEEARTSGLRLAEVEEFEFMLAFVDAKRRAHFIHFRDGIGPDGQHFEKCICRPETHLPLADP